MIIYEGRRENRKFLIPKALVSVPINRTTVWLRVSIDDKAMCQYSYSLDGKSFLNIGVALKAEKGTWIGAKVGLVALNPGLLKSRGFAEFEFFEVGR